MSRQRLAATVAAAVVAGVVVNWLYLRYFGQGSPSASPAQSRPSEDSIAFVRAAYRNLGEIWETADFVWEIPVENRAGHSITIDRISSSCSCTAITPSSLVIPPEQSRPLSVHIDLTTGRKPGTEPVPRELRLAIQPMARSGGKWTPLGNWEFHGKVKPILDPKHSLLDLGAHSNLAQPLAVVRCPVHAHTELRQIRCADPSPFFKARIERQPGQARDYDLVIQPK